MKIPALNIITLMWKEDGGGGALAVNIEGSCGRKPFYVLMICIQAVSFFVFCWFSKFVNLSVCLKKQKVKGSGEFG